MEPLSDGTPALAVVAEVYQMRLDGDCLIFRRHEFDLSHEDEDPQTVAARATGVRAGSLAGRN
jgi:hypothetical protein